MEGNIVSDSCSRLGRRMSGLVVQTYCCFLFADPDAVDKSNNASTDLFLFLLE